MPSDTYTQALLLGLMTFLAIFLALEHAGMMTTPQARRAGAVFGAVSGLLVMSYLEANPAVLEQMVQKNALAALGVLAALFALLRRR